VLGICPVAVHLLPLLSSFISTHQLQMPTHPPASQTAAAITTLAGQNTAVAISLIDPLPARDASIKLYVP